MSDVFWKSWWFTYKFLLLHANQISVLILYLLLFHVGLDKWDIIFCTSVFCLFYAFGGNDQVQKLLLL